MKILAYAVGGGLGHLTRLRAALYTLGLEDRADVMVVSASPAVDDPAVAGRRWHAALVPATLHDDGPGFESWLRDLAHRLLADVVIVDAFPLGLLGELQQDTFPVGTPRWHLSRLLRWDAYEARCGLLTPDAQPRLTFERVLMVEAPGSEEHRQWLHAAGPVETLVLSDPPADPDPDIPPGRCLVVHSGPPAEVDKLCRLARSACRENPFVVRSYPSWPSFADASFLVTGAGCNAVRQGAAHRHKHLVVAFPRALDDQYLRAVRARREAHSV